MVDYKHLYLEKIDMHLVEIDYESFKMHQGEYLYNDIIRKIPEVKNSELTYVLTVGGESMYYANGDGTIGADPIDMSDLGDIKWETYTYGTAFDKDSDVEDNSEETN
ncbi:MAG: hypothetical protein J5I47_03000 [Vicingus serpentipes]|nr:hypothetical protein [Vicingus serpentipes]